MCFRKTGSLPLPPAPNKSPNQSLMLTFSYGSRVCIMSWKMLFLMRLLWEGGGTPARCRRALTWAEELGDKRCRECSEMQGKPLTSSIIVTHLIKDVRHTFLQSLRKEWRFTSFPTEGINCYTAFENLVYAGHCTMTSIVDLILRLNFYELGILYCFL